MRTIFALAVLLSVNAFAHAAPKPAKAPASAAVAPDPDEKPKLVRSDTYACVPAANPQGFNWDGHRWTPVGFKPEEPFTLNVAVIQSGLQQYLHFQRKSSSEDSHCGTAYNPWIESVDSCSTVGETTVFSSKTASGAISRSLGATDGGESRDSVYIMPFTCQKFVQ